MSAKLNLTGKTFGNCKFISEAPSRKQPNGATVRYSNWMCLRCGNEFVAANSWVISGNTKSCGCLDRERTAAMGRANRVHGHAAGSTSRTLKAWSSIKQRCLNKADEHFPRYGGAGITICQRWVDSFAAFLEDMGECPPGLEIDRYPNKTGNYEPGNCRWATDLQQSRNKTNNHVVAIRGVSGCLSEVCERLGADYVRVQHRLNAGWSIEAAFFKPPRRYRRKSNPC